MPATTASLGRLVLAAAIAAGLSLAAGAQPLPERDAAPAMASGHFPGPCQPPVGEDPMPPFLRGMELSEAQQDRIFAILHAQAPHMREQAKAVRQAHDALHRLAFAEAYDDDRAQALAAAAGQAMGEMARLRLRSERQILAVLTPEQRQALAASKLP